MMPIKALEWTGRAVRTIDQTLLPGRLKYLSIRDDAAMWEAIRTLRVRGAPLIGVAAAYGLYLGVKARKPKSIAQLRSDVQHVAAYLASSRPTAVNLFWALERCQRVAAAFRDADDVKGRLERLLAEAQAIDAEDEMTCREIGRHGAPLLDGCSGVLTHCNAGALATAGMGTALSVIYTAAQTNQFRVFADETRPLLQGARLTAWELQREGIDTTLISDNMAGTVLQKGWVQAVVVGADRIAANGDAANKIGTMPLAIAANFYRVPFYVAAPLSTFDPAIKSGAQIPIEERSAEEVTSLGGVRTAPKGIRVFNPAFDVTPAKLIAGIVTERGVLRPPYAPAIRKALAG